MNSSTKPPRLTREESRLQTRGHLLDAAKRLFVRKGFGATSLRDIATEAGYSQGGFYSNFADKETLFLELMRQRASSEVSGLAHLLGNSNASTDDILNTLDVWSQSLDSDPDWSVLAVELELHASRNPAFAVASQALWSAHREGLARFFEQLFARLGRVPPESPALLATSFMGLAHGLALQRSAVANVPVGRMMMVFLRGLVASAERVG
ncbi:transcriptional regulator, TetR family [Paraburkholderia fungorum]|uniref:Transcriptional regulator, TetR family n=1 Tax=Paraburkholderia fungorum TaxID=134537 RepID=A0A1H1JHT7_9BURK|nr:TetR/AcrR family transcriptional regulator [Paraburkholderia fungorum]SDR49566.1 transcriptional regulator, TetR family [Paraburkholderia fungorum]